MHHTRFSLLAPLLAIGVFGGVLGFAPSAEAQEVVAQVAQAAPPQYAPVPPGQPPQYQPAPYGQPQYQPAPYGQPPQYAQPQYGPPPVYQQPYPQPPPPNYVQPQGPRVIKDWEPGTPIPPGYHVEEHARKGLIIGGAVMFGTTYLLSVLVAAADSDANSGNGSLGALYVPAIGPFIQMGNSSNLASGDVVLAIDGLAQLGGITMFALGLAYPNTELVRNDFGALHLHVEPVFAPDHQGVVLGGRF